MDDIYNMYRIMLENFEMLLFFLNKYHTTVTTPRASETTASPNGVCCETGDRGEWIEEGYEVSGYSDLVTRRD